MESFPTSRKLGLSYVRLFILLVTATGVRCLRDVSIEIPLAVANGSTVNMSCHYNLENDPLYTVKWYKGRQEFFRYVLKELPHTKVFPQPGVNVIVASSDAHRVVLRDVQLDLAGKYRCEVSADAPSFHTEMVAGYMYVVTPPVGDPKIHVEKLRYAVGDIVRGNCTAPSGNPPANVTWIVNEKRVNSTWFPPRSAKADEPLTSSVTGLDYEIVADSFKNGRLRLTCRATVFNVYEADVDIYVEEERPRLSPVLGTRESSHPGGSTMRESKIWMYVALAMILLWRSPR